MTVPGGQDEWVRAAGPGRPAAAGVLAERMAAALVHHEPGWRLPRLSALARRYHVGVGEIDAAIDALAARHLVRRLPDGQIYRISPAEYRVCLDGLSGLAAQVDPMGGQLACASCHAAWRPAPADIGRALALPGGALALAIRCLWTVGGEPAAVATSFVQQTLAAWLGAEPPEPGPAEVTPVVLTGGEVPVSLLCPWEPPAGVTAGPRALQLELALPPPSAARTLRLGPGEAAITITVTVADPGGRAALALARAVLRAGLFRVVLESGAPARGVRADFATTWTHAVEDWEP